jgi:cyanophycinase-like exopeptidase
MLALVGGAEFTPGNEDCDHTLLAAAPPGPRFVVPTAGARQQPERAIETARRWFLRLGAEIDVLPVLRRRDAEDPGLAERAAGAGFLYICGGDPGLLLDVLEGSRLWNGLRTAWVRGGSLAGSSAGAMALARTMLVRASWPDRSRRRARPALGLAPVDAVLPHFDGFGASWVDSALGEIEGDPLLLGLDERTAALWDGTGWTASGPGRVTLVRRTERQAFRSGAMLSLDDPT